jgi:hypothetical protein
MVGLKGAWYLGLVSTMRRGNNDIMHSSASSCGEGRGVRDAYGTASPHTAAHSETNSLGSGVPGMTTLRCTYSWFTRVSRKQKSTLHCAIEKYHITQYVHVMERNTSLFSKNINPKGVIMRSLYCYVSKEGIFIVYIKDLQKPPRFSFIPKNQASSAPCGG